jgi:hypothetical protein
VALAACDVGRAALNVGSITYPVFMPDSFGKRARRDVKARKAQAREERRLARNRRREDRAAGILEAGPPIAENDDVALGLSRLPPSPEPEAEASEPGS